MDVELLASTLCEERVLVIEAELLLCPVNPALPLLFPASAFPLKPPPSPASALARCPFGALAVRVSPLLRLAPSVRAGRSASPLRVVPPFVELDPAALLLFGALAP
jgi:hypothetical protein